MNNKGDQNTNLKEKKEQGIGKTNKRTMIILVWLPENNRSYYIVYIYLSNRVQKR